ncbi:MAG: exodeoxyribonuclease VII small subunit [Oscillospiraceae bacterium]|nr:exodeoxyribonuclease VII small subunit [Oscillospiraceae bacterium]
MQFEKSIEKLNNIIEKLEKEETTLEETLALYKEGSKLISSCKKEIENAKQVVSQFDVGEENESEE